jgi:membrane protease YdiL (CAAX protease family)
MRSLGLIVSYLLVVFLGGAAFAPWIYLGAQYLAGGGSMFEAISDQPFHRYVNRCLILFGVLGLWPLLRALGVRSWREAGLAKADGKLKDLARGFLIASTVLAAVAALGLICGGRQLNLSHSHSQWLKHFKNATLAAVFVAFVEELLFRGGLFASLRRQKSLWVAALISSSIYAALHFLARPQNPAIIEWNSGFIVLGRMFAGLADVQLMIPCFFTLTVLGLILCIAFEGTKAIYLSLGLHAAFIFWTKTYAFILRAPPGSRSWLWGSNKFHDGWLPFLVLLCLLMLFTRRLLAKPPSVRYYATETASLAP